MGCGIRSVCGLVHLPVNTLAFERPCIPARVVTHRSRTLRVRSLLAPCDQGAVTPTAPPRSELGFNWCWPYFRCGALSAPLVSACSARLARGAAVLPLRQRGMDPADRVSAWGIRSFGRTVRSAEGGFHSCVLT